MSSTEISEDSVSAESTEDNVSAPELVEEDQKLFDDIYYSCHAKKSSACSRTNEEATVLHIIDVMEAPLLFSDIKFLFFLWITFDTCTLSPAKLFCYGLQITLVASSLRHCLCL